MDCGGCGLKTQEVFMDRTGKVICGACFGPYLSIEEQFRDVREDMRSPWHEDLVVLWLGRALWVVRNQEG